MKFVYKILPYFIVKSNWLVPKWSDGTTYWMFIALKPEINVTKALIEHEKAHVRQMYRYSPILFALLYFLSDRWRLKFEIEAYRETIKYSESRIVENMIENIAKSLYDKYDIDHISIEDIINKLKKVK